MPSMQLMNAWASEQDTYKTFKGKKVYYDL
jgi:hypothetical protein